MKDKKKRVERFYKRRALKDFIILHSFIKLPFKFFIFIILKSDIPNLFYLDGEEYNAILRKIEDAVQKVIEKIIELNNN